MKIDYACKAWLHRQPRMQRWHVVLAVLTLVMLANTPE